MPSLVRLRALLVACAAAAVVAVVATAPPPAASKSGGANPGFAGNITLSDGTPQACTVCHFGADLNGGDSGLLVDVAGTAAPGETVPITITLDNQTPEATPGSRRQGFQATVRDPASGALWGRLVLSDAANTAFAGDGAFRDTSYVTHTLAGTGQTTWTFDWEPGAERSGTARVYVAANAANGNGTSSGDYVYVATADVVVGATDAAPAPTAAFDLAAPRPNPVRAGARARLGLRLDRAGTVTVSVVDGVGREVRRAERRDRAAGASHVAVATAGLAAGTYFVVVEGPGGRRVQPLAIVR